MEAQAKKIKPISGGVMEVLIIAALVIVARMLFEFVTPKLLAETGLTFTDELNNLFHNYPLLILTVLFCFIMVYLLTRNLPYGTHPITRSAFELIGIAVISLVVAFLERIMLPGSQFVADSYFALSLMVAFVVCALCVTFFDLIMYYRWKNRQALEVEVKMRSQANYQYQLLKNQLNPHFLFNSLNVLDYLIHTDTEKASGYLKKMANVYRYLLSTEDRTTVYLEEEMEFVAQYVDMMKERFVTGFDVNVDIPSYYSRFKVVPCSVQMLMENAVKHNIVNEKHPLKIDVTVKDDYLTVSNNLNPKIQTEPSTGKGLENIRRQYQILYKADIAVEKTDCDFTVRLPLFQ